jgi:RNA-directed DNA polymerase
MDVTYRNLWPAVVSWENLVAAYGKCRRRKCYCPGAADFDYRWEAGLRELQRELVASCYRPGGYRNFYIFEPKRRRISAAPFRDRVVHHAVVRVLEPIFERRFIFDSYAYHRGKGTHAALDRTQTFPRRHSYYLKTDVVRFFPNVDHAVLLGVVGKTIRDPRLMQLIAVIVDSGRGVLEAEATRDLFPGDDLFAVLRPRGLPIGNLTSQFFANVLLDRVDHFIKEVLWVSGYVRYADDMVLFADDKPALHACREEIADRLSQPRLRLHPDKTQIRPSGAGLKFLGFVLRPNGRRLQQSTLLRFSRRLRRLKWLRKLGMFDPRQIRVGLRAWLAHVVGVNSAGIRRDLWRRLRF